MPIYPHVVSKTSVILCSANNTCENIFAYLTYSTKKEMLNIKGITEAKVEKLYEIA